jgi:hypothetical protein
MPEEKPFEVVDRRRVRADGPDAGESAADPGEPSGVTEADLREAMDDAGERPAGAAGPALTVGGILRFTLELLNQRAWIALGLVADPVTGRVEADFAEAKRAIDVLAVLAAHVEADAAPEERRELQTLLSNLRINYVRQTSGSGGG